MPSATDRIEFQPPPQPGMLRAFGAAVFAHLLLAAALTWGVSWKHESQDMAAEAELWSATVQQAAPKLVEAPPPPPPPAPVPVPKPDPVLKVAPPPPPLQRDADIAIEREKKKQADLKKQEAENKQQELKKQADLKKQEDLKKQAEAKKQELAQKAEDKKKADAAKAQQQAKAADDARKADDARRKEALDRMQGLAGATGGATATGTAQRSSGPSDSYGGRIRARVKPNIVFSDDIAGNPTAEVEVRLAPDGTIIGKRIVKSSGVKSWDDAVLRALDKTEVLPRDVDGRVHTPLTIAFRPKD